MQKLPPQFRINNCRIVRNASHFTGPNRMKYEQCVVPNMTFPVLVAIKPKFLTTRVVFIPQFEPNPFEGFRIFQFLQNMYAYRKTSSLRHLIQQ